MHTLVASVFVLSSMLVAAPSARAQIENDAGLAAHKEAVWTYVRSGASELMVQAAERRVLAELDRSDYDLPADIRAWTTTNFAAASREVSSAIAPEVEQQMFNAYLAHFTPDEVKEILAYYEFVEAPARARIIAESGLAGSREEQLLILKQRLPTEEFAYLTQAFETSPMVKMIFLDADILGVVTDDYVERFRDAVVARCDSAPKGVAICETVRTPLRTLNRN
jgi:hypothetical protein